MQTISTICLRYNQDDTIDIADVVLLMQWILEIDRNFYSAVTIANFQQYDNFIAIESDGDIAGMQIESTIPLNITGFNFPPGWNWVQQGTNLVAYSLNGSTMPKSFKVNFEDNSKIVNVKLVDWEGQSVNANENILPDIYGLEISPNPFNSSCNISFKLENSKNIKVNLYNIKGELVEKIKLGFLNKGKHSIKWSPTQLPSGAYFIETSDGINSKKRKILYLK